MRDWRGILSAENIIKVLTIPHSKVEFQINREQCTTSVYIAETEERKTSCMFLQEGLRLKEKIIPLFNLDLFFQNFFQAQPSGEAHLALIRDKKNLSSEILEILDTLEDNFYLEEEVRQDMIAFRVASATIMTDVMLTELCLQPAVLAAHLEKQGVLAVSFPAGGRMRYMVDLDILFEEKILKALEDNNENSDC